ncbi:MAG: hypothetical protein ACJ763_09815 [Bdellovibrionia bacterium]
MPKVFVVSIAGLFVMLGVAVFAATQQDGDRGPASVTQAIPHEYIKNLYHSAKY